METMSSKVHPIKSKIQTFYEGKTILVTGGTGFLGKVLIEKLLRCCPNIKQIYLLVREKKGVGAEERLRQLVDCELFTRLKREHPGFPRKLTVLPGDLSQPMLGLSAEHVAVISQNVEVIFHSAATLRFDERLSVAINTNVLATKKLCQLAQNVINLEAFIYVSTAYCDCDMPLVKEKVPACRVSPDNLVNLVELLGEKTIDEIAPALLGTKPNTYIFTKCAAEEIIDKFKMTLPVAVFRPSIVLASVSEPVVGWIDNVLGPTGMTASLLAGLLHTALFNPKARANFVPVDYTVNGIITLGYTIGQRKWETSGELNIVNFVSTADNTITWGRFGDLLQAHAWRAPSAKLMWYPFGVRARHRWTYAVMRGLFHRLPATVIDWASARLGRPTKMKQFYSKLDRYAAVTRHFTLREFAFEEGAAERLWSQLEPADQEMFPFDMAALDWDAYIGGYVRGCRQFLLHEDPGTVAAGHRRIKLLYVIHLMTSSALFLVIFKVIRYVVRLVKRSKGHLQILGAK